MEYKFVMQGFVLDSSADGLLNLVAESIKLINYNAPPSSSINPLSWEYPH